MLHLDDCARMLASTGPNPSSMKMCKMMLKGVETTSIVTSGFGEMVLRYQYVSKVKPGK